MRRFISCLLFLVVLFSVWLLPAVDAKLDATVPMRQASAEVSNVPEEHGNDGPAQNNPAARDDTPDEETPVVKLSTPTPVPTPSPTPIPTPTPVPIKKGDSGDEVMRAQMNLISLGFMTTSPDGSYGKNTENAVAAVKAYLNKADKEKRGVMLSEEEIIDLGLATTPDPDNAASPDATPTPRPTRPSKYGSDGGTIPHDLAAELNDLQDFPILQKTIQRGDTGDDALRLQRRLNSLKYIHLGVDGKIGNATVEAVSNFQRLNGLTGTGIADEATLEKLYSSGAVENDKPLHPYKIYVSRKRQRVEVYMWNDSAEDYTIPYKSFICSTGKKGTETPAGTFFMDTGPAARWHKFTEFNCWAQYAYNIHRNVLFHSVLYKKNDERTLQRSSVSNLGRAASHGCVRLKVEDAKWIWDNCPAGTTVVIQ